MKEGTKRVLRNINKKSQLKFLAMQNAIKKLRICSIRALGYVVKVNQRPKDIKYVSTVRRSTD